MASTCGKPVRDFTDSRRARGEGARPRARGSETAAIVVARPVRLRIRAQYSSIVRWESFSRSATWRWVRPERRSCATSASRGVRVPLTPHRGATLQHVVQHQGPRGTAWRHRPHVQVWRARRDSNPRPPDPKTDGRQALSRTITGAHGPFCSIVCSIEPPREPSDDREHDAAADRVHPQVVPGDGEPDELDHRPAAVPIPELERPGFVSRRPPRPGVPPLPSRGPLLDPERRPHSRPAASSPRRPRTMSSGIRPVLS
jgi:hypothetical protein